MMDYDYYYDQYRRGQRQTSAAYKDLCDYHSTISFTGYTFWPESIKRPVTTTYIDGSTLLGLHQRPYSVKDSFPKGKGRRKPSAPCEKKINTGDTYISLVPTDKINVEAITARSEKIRSPLSIATGTQWSTLPDVQRKNADIRNNRIYSAAVVNDENSDAKFYGRCATTHASGGWVRRYKSINESQTLTDLLRDQAYRDKILLRKRTCQQLFLLSSSSKSTFNSTLTKQRRLAQC